MLLAIAGTAVGDTFIQNEGEVVVVSVDSTNLRFSPETITLTEGDSVRFFWSGELLAHNAVERDGLFNSGEPMRNVDYTYTFEIGENGTYEYVCEPHEEFGMVGTIVVNPAPIDQEEVEQKETPADKSLPGFGLWTAIVALSFAVVMSSQSNRK
tara:strand:- start:622 stop:1083 length:462 start_codon:yes stop_codon:yes gene_type:complete